MGTTYKQRGLKTTDALWDRLTRHAAKLTLRDDPITRSALVRRFMREGMDRDESAWARD